MGHMGPFSMNGLENLGRHTHESCDSSGELAWQQEWTELCGERVVMSVG